MGRRALVQFLFRRRGHCHAVARALAHGRPLEPRFTRHGIARQPGPDDGRDREICPHRQGAVTRRHFNHVPAQPLNIGPRHQKMPRQPSITLRPQQKRSKKRQRAHPFQSPAASSLPARESPETARPLRLARPPGRQRPQSTSAIRATAPRPPAAPPPRSTIRPRRDVPARRRPPGQTHCDAAKSPRPP